MMSALLLPGGQFYASVGTVTLSTATVHLTITEADDGSISIEALPGTEADALLEPVVELGDPGLALRLAGHVPTETVVTVPAEVG